MPLSLSTSFSRTAAKNCFSRSTSTASSGRTAPCGADGWGAFLGWCVCAHDEDAGKDNMMPRTNKTQASLLFMKPLNCQLDSQECSHEKISARYGLDSHRPAGAMRPVRA